jgi:nucleotide-binding universal stress UspA family protein
MSDCRSPSIKRILIPVDASNKSTEALKYAVAIAAMYDAAVHVVQVFGEDSARAIKAGEGDTEQIAADGQSITDTATTMAKEAGVSLSTSVAYGFSPEIKLRHPGSVILDTADEVNADFLVVPREPQSGTPGEVLSKAAEYALLYATQPVLSV